MKLFTHNDTNGWVQLHFSFYVEALSYGEQQIELCFDMKWSLVKGLLLCVNLN
jgi:hypothetical protein